MIDINKVKLTCPAGVGGARLFIDDVEVKCLQSFALSAEAGGLTRLQITLCADVEVEAAIGRR